MGLSEIGSSNNVATAAPQTATTSSKEYSVSADELAEFGIDVHDDAPKAKPTKTKTAEASKQLTLDESPEQDTEKILEALDDGSQDEDMSDLLAEEDSEASEDAAPTKTPEEEWAELDRFGVKTKMSKSKTIEYAQKGFDYETKMSDVRKQTQAIDSKIKEFETSKEKWERESAQVLQQNDQYNYFFDHLKSTNPELFEQVDQEATLFVRQTRNPYFEKALTTLQKQNEELKASVEKRDLDELRHSYYKELEDLKALHQQKYARFGITLDEDAIRKEWTEKGGSLKKIYGHIYGDKLLALAESQSLAQKKASNTAKVPTVGKVKSSKTSSNMSSKLKGMSYSQIADMLTQGGA